MPVSPSFASSIDSIISHEAVSLPRNPPFIDTSNKMGNPTTSPHATLQHLIDPPVLSSTTSSSRSTLSSALNSPPPPPSITSYSSYNSSACQSITSSPTDNTTLPQSSKFYFPHSLSPTPLSSNSSSHVILPPISSFTNLITVAEREFNGRSNSLHANFTAPVPRTVLDHQRHELSLCNPITAATVKNTTPSPPAQHTQHILSTVEGVPRSKSVSSLPVNGFPALMGRQQQQNTGSSTASTLPSIHSPLTNEHTDKYSSSLRDSSKIIKQRKKKECPICHNFYANLSTHKSTHLTPEDRPHKCPVCQRGFARNNDLIRHKKRHWKDEFMQIYARDPQSNSNTDDADDTPHVSATNDADDSDDKSAALASSSSEDTKLLKKNQLRSLYKIKGAFKCPYNSTLINLDMEVYPHKTRSLYFEPINCHQTGVFSRCDTFKNHLKALHFEYPPKTKKEDRSIVPGKCKHCGLQFPNVDVWLNKHVGKGCGYAYH